MLINVWAIHVSTLHFIFRLINAPCKWQTIGGCWFITHQNHQASCRPLVTLHSHGCFLLPISYDMPVDAEPCLNEQRRSWQRARAMCRLDENPFKSTRNERLRQRSRRRGDEHARCGTEERVERNGWIELASIQVLHQAVESSALYYSVVPFQPCPCWHSLSFG